MFACSGHKLIAFSSGPSADSKQHADTQTRQPDGLYWGNLFVVDRSMKQIISFKSLRERIWKSLKYSKLFSSYWIVTFNKSNLITYVLWVSPMTSNLWEKECENLWDIQISSFVVDRSIKLLPIIYLFNPEEHYFVQISHLVIIFTGIYLILFKSSYHYPRYKSSSFSVFW